MTTLTPNDLLELRPDPFHCCFDWVFMHS